MKMYKFRSQPVTSEIRRSIIVQLCQLKYSVICTKSKLIQLSLEQIKIKIRNVFAGSLVHFPVTHPSGLRKGRGWGL